MATWIIPTKIGHRYFDIPHCSSCNGVPCGVNEHTKFCANCGAPMNGEADIVSVVRCKDCKSRLSSECGRRGLDDDGFCSAGKRREEDCA